MLITGIMEFNANLPATQYEGYCQCVDAGKIIFTHRSGIRRYERIYAVDDAENIRNDLNVTAHMNQQSLL